MKKLVFILLVLVVLVGIGADTTTNSGCGGGSSKAPSKSDPYIGGTTGLTVQFEEGFPPEEVYDNAQYPFDVDVKLENVGESTVDKSKVQVKLTGINPDDFGLEEEDLIMDGIDENLEPTRKDAEGNIIDGSTYHAIFKDLNFQEKLDANFNPPLRAEVCYEYETRAVSDICVVENVIGNDKDAVCVVDEDKQIFNSGAPVVVTDFKEIARGQGKVGFSFNIKHKGSGKIFSPTPSSPLCSTALIHKNRVWVEVNTGLDGLSCTGLSDGEGDSAQNAGEAILYNGERSITCTQEVSSKLAYESRVEIKLVYDYKEDVTTNILVKYSSD